MQRIVFLLPLVFLAIFFCYPLSTILRLSFATAAGTAPAGLAALLADSYYLRVLWFSAWQAALSTLLTLLVGLPAAFVFARYSFPGKRLLRALATVPFVLPTVVVAAAFGALLGRDGLLNSLLAGLFGAAAPRLNIDRTLALVLLAHVFYNYSVVLRLVGSLWATLDPRIEQAAAVLGASRRRVFVEVTLPLLLPAIGAAALLVFSFCFASFGIILMLGNPRSATLEIEIYRQTAQALRLDIAAALALVQLAVTALLTLAYTRLQARTTVALDLRSRQANARPPRSWRAWLLVGANLLLLLLLIGTPLLALLVRSLSQPGSTDPTLAYYRLLGDSASGALFRIAPLEAVRNSLLFATLATMLALLIGIPAAYLLSRQTAGSRRRTADGRRQTADGGRRTAGGRRRTADGRWRTADGRRQTADGRRRTEGDRSSKTGDTRQETKGKRSLRSMSVSCLLSPVACLLSPVSRLVSSLVGGRWSMIGLLDALFMLPLGTSAVTLGLGYLLAFGRPPLNLISSPLLVPVAHALLALPFVVRSLLPALRGLDPQLRQAAAALGASPLRVLREVDLPLLYPALLVAAVFSFTVSLGDFGTALLIARPDYPTVPVAIFSLLGRPGASNYGQGLALSCVLMLMSVVSFLLLERLRYREVGEF